MTDFSLATLNQYVDFALLQAWVGNIVSGLLVLALGVFLSRRAGAFTRRALTRSKRFDKTLVPLASSVVGYTIMIVTIVVTLGNFGIQTTSIIAVLGAAGIAIGLALQGTLSNVASGVMLLFLRPFKAGDWVEVGGHSGNVDEIGLFTTTITTFDNVFVSVPNSTIWGATITNHSHHATRRMDIDIGIAYSSDLDLAENTLLSLAEDKRVLPDPKPEFMVVGYGDSAINVRLRLHSLNDDFFDLHWDLLRRLKPAFDRAGIEIPFPQREYRILGPDQ